VGMKILRSISELSEVSGPVTLSIGVFDGVHLGHQAVLQSAMGDAATSGATAVALTFDPHPARILRKELAPRLLTSTPHKARLIEALGMPYLLVVPFDEVFAAQPAEMFIRALAATCHPLRKICVGEQWAFGHNRTGNVALLRKLGGELDFTVTETPAVAIEGGTISSTRIRNAVEQGDLDTARMLLGRDYTILGTVEHGDELGRRIGFPTANLRAHNEQFPPDGVYAVRVQIDDAILPGVANVGYRPTVSGGIAERKLEVHIFDFEGDLYGRDIDVDFIAFLRGEKKFENLDALKVQIGVDAGSARQLLTPR
jgi:riboflavin kinase/FMN adenylyltransferase